MAVVKLRKRTALYENESDKRVGAWLSKGTKVKVLWEGPKHIKIRVSSGWLNGVVGWIDNEVIAPPIEQRRRSKA